MNTQSLPFSAHLPRELSAALARKQCLVLMFSLPGCPFCKVVRESYLWPLRLEQGFSVLQVDVQSPRTLFGLDGKRSTHADWARAMGVNVTPTVAFMGKKLGVAAEMAERLTGAYIPDFYGAYLQQRLDAAQAQINATVLR
jgi:thioredoxin-related protein